MQNAFTLSLTPVQSRQGLFTNTLQKQEAKGETSQCLETAEHCLYKFFLQFQNKKRANVKSEHRESLRSDTKVSRQQHSEDLQVQTVQARRCNGQVCSLISAKKIWRVETQPPEPLTLNPDNVTQHYIFISIKAGMINEEPLGNT